MLSRPVAVPCWIIHRPHYELLLSEVTVPIKSEDSVYYGLARAFCNFGEHILKHPASYRLIQSDKGARCIILGVFVYR